MVSDLNRETFFVLGSKFISWERICEYLIKEIGSTSQLVVEGNRNDAKNSEDALTFGVGKLKKVLGFDFNNEWSFIQEHLLYFVG